MNTVKLTKFKINSAPTIGECGVHYSVMPFVSTADNTCYDDEFIWCKEFELPEGYRVDEHDERLNIFDNSEQLMIPVPIIDIKGKPAISTFSGATLILKEVINEQ